MIRYQKYIFYGMFRMFDTDPPIGIVNKMGYYVYKYNRKAMFRAYSRWDRFYKSYEPPVTREDIDKKCPYGKLKQNAIDRYPLKYKRKIRNKAWQKTWRWRHKDDIEGLREL